MVKKSPHPRRSASTPRWRGKDLAVIAALQRSTDRPKKEKFIRTQVGATTCAGDLVRLRFHWKHRLLIAESPVFRRGEFVKGSEFNLICTVTPITNSKQVESYYARDDYYSRDAKREDYWQGKLSKNVGLNHKRVDKKHFATLIEMTDKRKNEGQKPTLGVDITFSCPKSVSILQAVSSEYREIVNQCIAEVTDEMITLIEKKFIRTRRGYGGKSLEYTQNILAAGINHEVNRKDELDRHTHIFIPNMTLTEDRKILTIDIKYLMKQQKLFGAIARAKLAAKLQREGIELERVHTIAIDRVKQ